MPTKVAGTKTVYKGLPIVYDDVPGDNISKYLEKIIWNTSGKMITLPSK